MKALSRGWLLRAIPIAALAVVGAAILASLYVASSPPKSTVIYRGKSLDDWFYGARTNFFSEKTVQARKQAFQAVGTNAFPFLLSKVRGSSGNGALYCRLYPTLPAWARSRTPFPISSDDIRAVALNDIREMGGLSTDQVEALANCVPRLGNPRVKMSGFWAMRAKHQPQSAFLEMCRKLLEDKQPGIQLEAAIYLGKSALAADPREPRLFPILIDGFESKETRKAARELSSYTYRQWPPGSPAPLPAILPPYYRQWDEDTYLKDRIEDALLRLQPYMTAEQKERFRRAEQMQKDHKKSGR